MKYDRLVVLYNIVSGDIIWFDWKPYTRVDRSYRNFRRRMEQLLRENEFGQLLHLDIVQRFKSKITLTIAPEFYDESMKGFPNSSFTKMLDHYKRELKNEYTRQNSELKNSLSKEEWSQKLKDVSRVTYVKGLERGTKKTERLHMHVVWSIGIPSCDDHIVAKPFYKGCKYWCRKCTDLVISWARDFGGYTENGKYRPGRFWKYGLVHVLPIENIGHAVFYAVKYCSKYIEINKKAKRYTTSRDIPRGVPSEWRLYPRQDLGYYLEDNYKWYKEDIPELEERKHGLSIVVEV